VEQSIPKHDGGRLSIWILPQGTPFETIHTRILANRF